MIKKKYDRRIEWIDTLRGICMLMILFFHTDVYYNNDVLIPYQMYVHNALATFFLISGYLFFLKGDISFKKRLTSIFKRLIIPYFVFTTIIMGIKVLLRNENFDVLEILSGNASWFVSTLIVIELLFTIIYNRFKLPALLLFIISITFLIISVYVTLPGILSVIPIAMVFFSIGMIWNYFSSKITINNKYCNILTITSCILISIIKVIEYHNGMTMTMYYVNISNWALFFTDSLLFMPIIILLSKYVSRINFINYIGRNSLYYYFMCGGIPYLVSLSIKKICDFNQYNIPLFIITYIIVVCITTVVVSCITKILNR